MKLGPVFMLTIHLMLQMDQRIHSVGKRNDFRVTIDLDPAVAVKRLRKDAKGSARVAPQVIDLVCGFPAADDHPTITIQSRCYSATSGDSRSFAASLARP